MVPSPTRCLTSHLVTPLLIWRNPQGVEENWRNEGSQHRPGGIKSLLVGVGLAALAATLLIEFVVYQALRGIAYTFSHLNHRPYRFCDELLQSSKFTIEWIQFLVGDNLTLPNLFTHESFERVKMCSSRGEDERYVEARINQLGENINSRALQNLKGQAQWIRERRALSPQQIEALRCKNHPLTQDGINLIVSIVKNAGIRSEILEDDPQAMLLVLSHAIFEYAFGTMRGATHGFFKLETAARIGEFRQNEPSLQRAVTIFNLPKFSQLGLQQESLAVQQSIKTIRALTQIFDLPISEFLQLNLQKIEDPEVRKIIGTINTLVAEEVRGSSLLNYCLQAAKKKLSAEQGRIEEQ